MSATEDLADSPCALRDDARELIYGIQPLLTLAIVHGREAEECMDRLRNAIEIFARYRMSLICIRPT